MKTRFCPSPTGEIHLGNARTALLCDLLAKNQRGHFLLRIEDTDQARSEERFIEQLYQDLHWLGIYWQEGPDVGGDAGPYIQSKRHQIYEHYYKILKEKNLCYPCFCSNEQLNVHRKIQLSRGIAPRYPGTCSHLSQEEITAKLAEGEQPTQRFRVPKNMPIEFIDIVKGPQRFNTDDIGDFIIQRADGTAPFLYCNALDDALMGITYVLRGEDHLANTPRQLLILEALELTKPHYGHLSLIMASDGAPLSKRHGSRSIRELNDQGFLFEGVVNYLARLGHYYSNPQYMDFETLAKEFSIEHLGRAAAHFDESQLMHWQKEAVMRVSSERLWQWLGEAVHQKVPKDSISAFIETIRGNIIFPNDALLFADIIFGPKLQYDSEAVLTFKQAGSDYFNAAIQAVSTHNTDFKKVFDILKSELQLNGKALFQPMRIALTGQLHGPELARIAQLMGIDRIYQRLEEAKSFCV